MVRLQPGAPMSLRKWRAAQGEYVHRIKVRRTSPRTLWSEDGGMSLVLRIPGQETGHRVMGMRQGSLAGWHVEIAHRDIRQAGFRRAPDLQGNDVGQV